MQNSFFNKIKKISKILTLIRFLTIILLFVISFNLLFEIDFNTLKSLPAKEKILYVFKYPTKLIQIKKDAQNALVLLSALQYQIQKIKNQITRQRQNNKKTSEIKKSNNLQREEGFVKQAISKKENLVILRFDGSVIAFGNNDYGQYNVDNWNDIIEIGVGTAHTVGLKKDGTVIAIGNNDFGQCNVSNWKDIISIGAGNFHTVGLKKDGKVIATGNNDFGQCNVSNWENIIAIKIGENFSIGLQDNNKEFVVGRRTFLKRTE